MNLMLQKLVHLTMNHANFQLQKVYQTDHLTIGHRNTSFLQKLIQGFSDFGERTTRGFVIGWLTNQQSAANLFSTFVSE